MQIAANTVDYKRLANKYTIHNVERNFSPVETILAMVQPLLVQCLRANLEKCDETEYVKCANLYNS